MDDILNQNQQRAMDLFRQAYELQMNGRLEEAAEAYRQSIDCHPTAEAHTFLGWTYSFMGRYDEAIEECRTAISIDPEFGNPYNDIGAYLIEKNRLDEAISWLEKAAAAPRYEHYCFPYHNLGRIYERKREWDLAIQAYERSLKENPQYVPAARALGRLKAMLN